MYTDLSDESISKLAKAIAHELAGGLVVNVVKDAPAVAQIPEVAEVAEQPGVLARFKTWLV